MIRKLISDCISTISKKIIISFIIGAISVNILLFLSAGWKPDSGSFTVFAVIIQSIIAFIAVSTVLWPGFFEELKSKQNIRLKIDREFRDSINFLSITIGLEKHKFQRMLNDINESIEKNEDIKYLPSIKKSVYEVVNISPGREKFIELRSEASKYDIKIDNKLTNIYMYGYFAYLQETNDVETRFEKLGLRMLDNSLVSRINKDPEALLQYKRRLKEIVESRIRIAEDLEYYTTKGKPNFRTRMS